jgi:hypothetical protein
VFFREDAFATQILQRPLEFVGKRLEHTSDNNSGRRGNKHDKWRSEGCQGIERPAIPHRRRPFVTLVAIAKIPDAQQNSVLFSGPQLGKEGDSLSARVNLPVGSNVKSASHSLFIAIFSNINPWPALAARRFPL